MTKAYPNDLTKEQWELIAELFPAAKTGGRLRTTNIYAVMNAILYVLCQGCTWRALPGEFRGVSSNGTKTYAKTKTLALSRF